MIIQKVDIKLVRHILNLYNLKFPLVPIKSGCLFSSKENPLFRARVNSAYYYPRTFVFGVTTSMRTSNNIKGSCDGHGGTFTQKRIDDAKLCTESIYLGLQ